MTPELKHLILTEWEKRITLKSLAKKYDVAESELKNLIYREAKRGNLAVRLAKAVHKSEGG